jgi:ABC-type multidrug transport system fused ATPase/permease subunit
MSYTHRYHKRLRSEGKRGLGQTPRNAPIGKKLIQVRRLGTLLPDVWALIRPRKYLFLLGLLLVAINRISALVMPASTKFLIDDVVVKRDSHILLIIVLSVLGATVVQAATSFLLTQLLSKAAWELITDLRIRVQSHIGRLPVAYFDANRTGALVSRIMSDVEGIRNFVGTGLVEFLGGLLTALLAFIMLLRIDSTLTLLCFAILVLFTLVLRGVFQTLRPVFHQRSVLYADITGRLAESLGGVRVVKGYRAEARESAIFASGVRKLLASIMQSLTATSLMSLSSTTVVGVVAALVMWMGARAILHGTLTLGGYVSYTVFLAFLVAPVFQVAAIGTQLTEAAAGFERTLEVMSETVEDSDPRRTLDISAETFEGNIGFENVFFAYQADKPVLRGISFDASPGSMTALVGPSGSGKSTIISLICGFHNPDSGVIRVDGEDLQRITLAAYRSKLGVVLQESFLFDGSIRENIRFSRPAASDEEILEAAHIARVDEFALRFPDGYETVVGERGVKLSGGQRQRISIARAILANPRILILDEATSSLDSESEALIQHGLAYLMRGRTTFVIAHRLSTIRRADQILFIEHGQIREQGSHVELLRAAGRYYQLYTRQHAIEENLFLAPGEGDPTNAENGESAGDWVVPSFSQTIRGI